MLSSFRNNCFFSGARYLFAGAKLIWHPKLRIFILVPLVINCVLFMVLTTTLWEYFWSTVSNGTSFIPESIRPWIEPFAWFVWFILAALLLVIYGYSFNVITNIIAAPFYGMLAEATEKVIRGVGPPEESRLKLLLRVFPREFSKLLYFLERGILVILVMVLIGFIPLVQSLVPLLGLAWGAWSMAIQYADYPADNHQISFSTTRHTLWQQKKSSLGFGSAIMVCSFIPIINIFAMPAAVAGGTLYWLNELEPTLANNVG